MFSDYVLCTPCLSSHTIIIITTASGRQLLEIGLPKRVQPHPVLRLPVTNEYILPFQRAEGHTSFPKVFRSDARASLGDVDSELQKKLSCGVY